jgi:hypothetical protein
MMPAKTVVPTATAQPGTGVETMGDVAITTEMQTTVLVLGQLDLTETFPRILLPRTSVCHSTTS